MNFLYCIALPSEYLHSSIRVRGGGGGGTKRIATLRRPRQVGDQTDPLLGPGRTTRLRLRTQGPDGDRDPRPSTGRPSAISSPTATSRRLRPSMTTFASCRRPTPSFGRTAGSTSNAIGSPLSPRRSVRSRERPRTVSTRCSRPSCPSTSCPMSRWASFSPADSTRRRSPPISHKPRTFTLGIDVKHRDEAPAARLVAEMYGTDHHEERVGGTQLEPALALMPSLFDEPFGDSAAWSNWAVARMAKKHVTVVLSGEGGDELFLGYQRHQKQTGAVLNPIDAGGRRACPDAEPHRAVAPAQVVHRVRSLRHPGQSLQPGPAGRAASSRSPRRIGRRPGVESPSVLA